MKRLLLAGYQQVFVSCKIAVVKMKMNVHALASVLPFKLQRSSLWATDGKMMGVTRRDANPGLCAGPQKDIGKTRLHILKVDR